MQATIQQRAASFGPGIEAAEDLQRNFADMAGFGSTMELTEAATGKNLLIRDKDLSASERWWRFGWNARPAALGFLGAIVDRCRGVKKAASEHHIMTNKNTISQAAGGPYTPKFEALAKRRGITLNDAMNRMPLSGHQGPHPAYNEAVYKQLEAATFGLYGEQFNSAFDAALTRIRTQTGTPGTILNRLATGQ